MKDKINNINTFFSKAKEKYLDLFNCQFKCNVNST